jgi:FxsC-like protein
MAEFVGVIDMLATRIIDVSEEYKAFAKNNYLPSLSEVPGRFGEASVVAQRQSEEPRATGGRGPNFVNFIYVAPSRQIAAQEIRRVNIDAYGERDGAEWSPYYPEDAQVEWLAQNVASSPTLKMRSGEIHLIFDSNKMKEILVERQSGGELVVFIVDPWVARADRYRSVLKDIDENNFRNWSFLVPFNEKDEESSTDKSILEQCLELALPFRSESNVDFRFRKWIPSEEAFRQELKVVLSKLRLHVVAASKPATSFLPSGGARPSLNTRGI